MSVPAATGSGESWSVAERSASVDVRTAMMSLLLTRLTSGVSLPLLTSPEMVEPDGVSAGLDWELAHVGDPMRDLGGICTAAWRYSVIDKPVGGFGEREDVMAGYEAAGGGRVDHFTIRCSGP